MFVELFCDFVLFCLFDFILLLVIFIDDKFCLFVFVLLYVMLLFFLFLLIFKVFFELFIEFVVFCVLVLLIDVVEWSVLGGELFKNLL